MLSTPKPIRVLVPFRGDWEDQTLEQLERRGLIVLHREGFDLRRFPAGLELLWFDSRKFVARMCRKYRGRIDAVWSCDEQFGCLIASAIAERLALPHAAAKAVVTAQHKLLMRQALARSMPEASVMAAAVPYGVGDRRLRNAAAIDAVVQREGLQWPLFAKPIKATFSVLARRVKSAGELVQHIRLTSFDRYLVQRMVRPFESLAREYVDLPCAADCPLLEVPMRGRQVNVDGYARRGVFDVLGIVDEWMYDGEVAGARHFAGFTYPSRLAAHRRMQITDTAIAAMRAIGFDHGLFNVELFLCDDGSVRVIEINPRGAGQFASFYRDVDGRNFELMGIWLSAGRDPRDAPREEPRAKVAGSFVWRRFDGRAGAVPSKRAQTWLATEYPTAKLWLLPTSKRCVEREYRWLGSHRYAVLNCAAEDYVALQSLVDECGQQLFGPAPAMTHVPDLLRLAER